MSKVKHAYVCNACGAESPKWAGQCSDCSAWNTLVEITIASTVGKQGRFASYAGEHAPVSAKLNAVKAFSEERFSSGLTEFDRVLGGGLVPGSVVLIGGDPGIGKSTLLLQTACHFASTHKSLYVTGEESLQQISLRAKRLGLDGTALSVVSATQVEQIIELAKTDLPRVMVVDSIQTVYTELLQAAPGSVSQVRESAAQLVRYAKQTNTVLILVGHVTKEGTLAGPRVLEHMVDTVLYFENERDNRFRLLRAVKNRFGAANELGIFAMTDNGLRTVNNPSAIFLSHYSDSAPGSVVTAMWEGSRPLLVEVQALVDDSPLANPRRVAVGIDHNRLSMLLAILHRHGGIATFQQDVFVNVVGGMRITETGADLAVLLAVRSSLRNRALANGCLIIGEVGLSGEIRPVQGGQERLRAAAQHGFKTAIIPFGNQPKQAISGIKIHAVKRLEEALSVVADE